MVLVNGEEVKVLKDTLKDYKLKVSKDGKKKKFL